jgi:hypothetical protein
MSKQTAPESGTSGEKAAVAVWDNTGGPSPSRKPASWSEAKTPWPVGPLVATTFRPDDPLTKLRKRILDVKPMEGFVLVKPAEIEAVLARRTCRSTEAFDRDEDGPHPRRLAYCVFQAGHEGDHSNGYYRWPARTVSAGRPDR